MLRLQPLCACMRLSSGFQKIGLRSEILKERLSKREIIKNIYVQRWRGVQGGGVAGSVQPRVSASAGRPSAAEICISMTAGLPV